MRRVFPFPLHTLKLRYKVGLFFVFPIVLIVFMVLGVNYVRERHLIQEHLRQTTFQIGQMALGSLHHAFMANDQAMQSDILRGLTQNEIKQIWIVNLVNRVQQSSDPTDAGRVLSQTDVGCLECHRYSVTERPPFVSLQQEAGIMRISIPIPNDPACQQCHSTYLKHLGVLLMDTSLANADAQLNQDILYLSGITILLVVALVFLGFGLIQGLIVHRVEVIYAALSKLGAQDFSVRITKHWHIEDEITQLAHLFNQVAMEFERLQMEGRERELVRAQAIVEERERIARELHDGVAQFLGYLSAKIGAIRFAIKNNKLPLAEQHLHQVEEALQSQSVEVRSAIIGLKMASNAISNHFIESIREFAEQCSRLDELKIRLETVGDVYTSNLSSETLLQLFRILQEAISNVRKHSRAKEALIRLEKRTNEFIMTIRDEGVGFDPFQVGLEKSGHFGLQIMLERARAIGATIDIKSAPAQGTQITVTVTE